MSQVKNDKGPIFGFLDAFGKEAGRVVNEGARHVTESIAEVQKGVQNGGFVGGFVAAADKLSLGTRVVGLVDMIIPGADLPKPLAEGIAGAVNLMTGNPVGFVDMFQAFSAAGGDGGASAPANNGAGQPTQTPESPSAAVQQPRPEPAPQTPVHFITSPPFPSIHPGGGFMTKSRDAVTLMLGDGNDVVDIRKTANGNVRVTVNGESITLSAADARKLVISGGDGNDRITVGPGVTGVYARGGDGRDVIISHADDTTIDGGRGNDTIRSSGDGSRIDGGRGHDNIVANGDGTRVSGGTGNDRLVANGDGARIIGGRGDDTIIANGDNARIGGGRGRDRIIVNGDGARVHGGRGNDSISVRGDDAIVKGGSGRDNIGIDGRRAIVDGGRGKDTINIDAGPKIKPGLPRPPLRQWYTSPKPERACDHNEFIGRARDIAERGGGFSAVETALGGLEGMYGEIGELLGQGKANDATKKKIAKMEKESNEAIAQLDKILNNPNLSFEDMIFMLMGALMKQSQKEVKGMTAEVREQKIAADAVKRELAADFDAKEAKVLDLEAKVRKDPKDEGAAKQLGEAKSELRKAGDARSDQISEANDSRQEQLEAIKNAMNKITEMQQTLSNILNSMHQTAMSTIGNIR